MTKDELAVFDPKGPVKARLTKRGIAFTEVGVARGHLPAKAKVLVVGPDALTPRQATDPMWQALAAGGMRVLVLDQDESAALPGRARPTSKSTDHVGRIAFPENLEHPAFAGLGNGRLLHAGPAITSSTATPTRRRRSGARSLLQCDDELSLHRPRRVPGARTACCVLCQAVVGSKLDTDPVAQRLFDNMLDYCAAYKPPAKATVVVLPTKATCG